MQKKQTQLIAGLDIGSNTVRMAVGQETMQEDGRIELSIIGAAEVLSEGVHKGVLNSIEEVVSSVSACLEQVERMAGVPIESAWLGISDTYVCSQSSKGVVAVSKADNEVAEDDIERAIDAARSISTPLNYELLHVLPKSYGVDGQTGIKDPVGMTGVRLELNATVVLGYASQVKNITKAVYRAGLDIDGLVFSILAASEAVLTSKQKELGVAVVDIGGSTTSVAVYEEGDLLHTAVLPIGSEYITNDLAIGLRTSIDVAERVKIECGTCLSETVSKKEEIELVQYGGATGEMAKRREVAEIIEARVEEILHKVENELQKVGRSGLLPAGVIFIGAGSKISGLIELAKQNLRLPATLGYPLHLTSITEKVVDIGFVTAVGLVKWGGLKNKTTPHGQNFIGHGLKKISQAPGRFKEWFRLLIP